METNQEAEGASSILTENRDRYLLSPCTANTWFVVELCDQILIDTFILANYEMFSSSFHEFSFYASETFPPESWHHLGTYFGEDTRDTQKFEVSDPLIWARYVLIEIHSFHGREFYCPLNLIRVFGTTMVEDYLFEITEMTPPSSESSKSEPASPQQLENLLSLTGELINDAMKVLFGSPTPPDSTGSSHSTQSEEALLSKTEPEPKTEPEQPQSDPKPPTSSLDQKVEKEPPSLGSNNSPENRGQSPPPSAEPVPPPEKEQDAKSKPSESSERQEEVEQAKKEEPNSSDKSSFGREPRWSQAKEHKTESKNQGSEESQPFYQLLGNKDRDRWESDYRSNIFKEIVGRLLVLEKNMDLTKKYFEDQIQNTLKVLNENQDEVKITQEEMLSVILELENTLAGMVCSD